MEMNPTGLPELLRTNGDLILANWRSKIGFFVLEIFLKIYIKKKKIYIYIYKNIAHKKTTTYSKRINIEPVGPRGAPWGPRAQFRFIIF